MRVAIIGTGVSGLVCASLLRSRHEITVFEAAPRLGGHVRTVPVELGGETYEVDTGFIVYNERTYPGFTRLLSHLGVASDPTEMSFSVRCERTGLEYSGSSLDGLFAQRRNLLRPSFYRMVRDILRFQQEARELADLTDEKVSLGEWLDGQRYSREFVEQHILPMGAAIWSSPETAMREFPAVTFARFFRNHGLLELRDRPQWRVVRGGSARYVERLVTPFEDRIRLATPVRRVCRTASGVELETDHSVEPFDEVVLATHSDQALRLLAEPSRAERGVLGAIRYRPNEAVLHTDVSLLPRSRRAWAAWNHHLTSGPGGDVAVTYHMNTLQGLTSPEPLCVTLNHSEAVDPARILARESYSHPVFDTAAISAQRDRPLVSGVDRIHYCGAYWRHGFHEDGLWSGTEVARDLGVEIPW